MMGLCRPERKEKMKIIDEKGKLFGLVNVIDLCIILFVAIVAAVCVKFFSVNAGIDAKTKQSVIKIEVTAQEKDLCDAMKPGKNISDRIQNKQLGKLVDVEVKPCEEYNVSSETGEHIKSLIPDRYDAVLTIEASSTEDLYVGKRMSVETKDFVAAGYIIDIEK